MNALGLILACLFIFLCLLALELCYFRVARRLNIVDKPNDRSSHNAVILRGGGVVFLFGVWLHAPLFGLAYPWFLLGVTVAAAMSFADDVSSLSDAARLVAQIVAMLLTFHQIGILTVEGWWVVVIALIVSVGICNAYNFMDGINGMTGAYSLAVIAPLIYLNGKIGFIDQNFLIVIALSVVVFCLFNFRKRAKCFAGDVGAVTMAFIALLALGKLIEATGDLSYIGLLAVYGVDSVLTICHRIMLRENLGQAHRKHAYQLMANELGLPHLVVSSLYAVLQFGVSCGLIFLSVDHWLYLTVVLLALGLAYIAFMRRYYHLHAEYLARTGK